jgi:hypothetical protein
MAVMWAPTEQRAVCATARQTLRVYLQPNVSRDVIGRIYLIWPPASAKMTPMVAQT